MLLDSSPMPSNTAPIVTSIPDEPQSDLRLTALTNLCKASADTLRLLVLRRDREIVIFRNSCPHTRESLDPMGGSVASADGQLIDPYGGQQDLKQRLLRHELSIHLSTAQAALLEKQASVFFAAINAAHAHLQTHYDSKDTAVQSVLAELQRLAGITLHFDTNLELASPAVVRGL